MCNELRNQKCMYTIIALTEPTHREVIQINHNNYNALYSSKKLVGLVNDFFYNALLFFDNKKHNKLIALYHAGICIAIVLSLV